MTTLDTALLFPAPDSKHDLDADDEKRAWGRRDDHVKRLHEFAQELRAIYLQELDKLQEHTLRRREIERDKSAAD